MSARILRGAKVRKVCVLEHSVGHACEHRSVQNALPAVGRGGVSGTTAVSHAPGRTRPPAGARAQAPAEMAQKRVTCPALSRLLRSAPHSTGVHAGKAEGSQIAAEDAEPGRTGLPFPSRSRLPLTLAGRSAGRHPGGLRLTHRLAGRAFCSLVLALVREMLAERLPHARDRLAPEARRVALGMEEPGSQSEAASSGTLRRARG